ncbi:hypothetical protein M2282_003242 [Variovorax boronicumulans]|nr:hypothetical protein [Variovorax boronicumulans]
MSTSLFAINRCSLRIGRVLLDSPLQSFLLCIVRRSLVENLVALLALPGALVHCRRDVCERVSTQSAKVAHGSSNHVSRGTSVLSRKQYTPNNHRIVEIVQRNGRREIAKVVDFGHIKSGAPLSNVVDRLPIFELKCDVADEQGVREGEFNYGVKTPEAAACVVSAATSKLHFVLPVDVDSRRSDGDNREDRLDPTRPFCFCHAEGPPVNSNKAIFGNSRHFASPRFARMVARPSKEHDGAPLATVEPPGAAKGLAK